MLNEAYCRVDPAANTFCLRLEDGRGEQLSGMCGEIKFPSGTTNFLISRREQEFSERWTGYLTMAVAGTYNLFITSDDGSRLFVDRVLVVESGRICGITEKTGALDLKVGPRRLCWTASRVGVRLT